MAESSGFKSFFEISREDGTGSGDSTVRNSYPEALEALNGIISKMLSVEVKTWSEDFMKYGLNPSKILNIKAGIHVSEQIPTEAED